MRSLASLVIVHVLFWVPAAGGNDLARGLNTNIGWVTLDEGRRLSKEQSKPLMLLIHKSWCGACQSLKPRFAESVEIEEMSSSFVMVNTLDDEEPDGSQYNPDGLYIPRILFFMPSGRLMHIINEAGSDEYKFYYNDPSDIVDSMRRCLGKAATRPNGYEEL